MVIIIELRLHLGIRGLKLVLKTNLEWPKFATMEAIPLFPRLFVHWHSYSAHFIKFDRDINTLKSSLEESLNVISNWFNASGLRVNDNKTEVCIFSGKDMACIDLNINGQVIQSKKEINVLGIIFDSKLEWGPQVANPITKSTRALNAISLIRNYFNQEELLKLITSNVYSISRHIQLTNLND